MYCPDILRYQVLIWGIYGYAIVLTWPNLGTVNALLVRFGGISISSFGLAMGILARIHLAKDEPV